MYSSDMWDDRYKAGKDSLPWDTGMPAEELVEYFQRSEVKPTSVLEIGCGTGTNAVWMAQQGCTVVANDYAPTAIAAAIQKNKDSGVEVKFEVSDILAAEPVPAGSVDFVFDRGVYHVMAPDVRSKFIDRVHTALGEGGFWLCLAGNADEFRPEGVEGPPQLKASELVDEAEKQFEIVRMERARFVLPDNSPHLAWKVVYRKRAKQQA
ncbi:MAG: class I SAM-dependent methyltransferase [Candidatus Melainabacteria bacterium]|nr:class I SAM-dependent methyltransferase [Candidatus Melainabacteria bacterium]